MQVLLRAEPVRGGYYIILDFAGAINFDGVIYKAAAPGGDSTAVLRIDKTCQVGAAGAWRTGCEECWPCTCQP